VTDPFDPLDLAALEAAARARLERGVYDYIAGGADAELTLADNLPAGRGCGCAPMCCGT
jgi:hypothetical protein